MPCSCPSAPNDQAWYGQTSGRWPVHSVWIADRRCGHWLRKARMPDSVRCTTTGTPAILRVKNWLRSRTIELKPTKIQSLPNSLSRSSASVCGSV